MKFDLSKEDIIACARKVSELSQIEEEILIDSKGELTFVGVLAVTLFLGSTYEALGKAIKDIKK